MNLVDAYRLLRDGKKVKRTGWDFYIILADEENQQFIKVNENSDLREDFRNELREHEDAIDWEEVIE